MHQLKSVYYRQQKILKIFFWTIFIFLYSPLITVIIYSFNDSKRNIVWRGFTTKYYIQAFNNESLIKALFNSLIIATISTIISVVLGVLGAYSLWKFNFAFKAIYEKFLILPLVIPEICMGIAMMLFFNLFDFHLRLSWPLNLLIIIIAHISFSFPLVTIIIRAKLKNFNQELEDVALDLGASNSQILKDIIIPFLKPAVIAGGILSFVLSLDDFVVTFFIATPGTITLPLKIYSMMRFSVTPEVNAVSTILIVITLSLVVVFVWIQNKNNYL